MGATILVRRLFFIAERTMPHARLVPIITWWIEGGFTDKVKGKVTKLGPSIGVGAIEPEKLTDELIVPMGELKVAIRLPEELQSSGWSALDFEDNSFVLVDP